MDHITTLAPSHSVHQETGLKSVNHGENVTLRCTRESDEAIFFYWYKQTQGQKPQLISQLFRYGDTASLHDEFKDDPRFIVQTENNWNNLKILDLHYSDSATYHCIGSDDYGFKFKEGVILSVKGSGSAIVHQPVSEWVQRGDYVTLNCTVRTETCDGEVNVYWFTNSGKSHPGVIYTNRVKNTHCERRAETQTVTCFYTLPKNNLTSSDAGTYYCAVVSCGEILFGNGTKISFKKESLVLVYFMGMVLGFTSVLAVILSYCVLKMRRRTCRHCPEAHPAFVSSKLDYCNTLIIGIPGRNLQKLQYIQNSAARILMRVWKHHITPILASMLWLPISHRINFKTILLTFKYIHGNTPPYLKELLTPCKPSCNLQSGTSLILHIHRMTLHSMGNWAFCSAPPISLERPSGPPKSSPDSGLF
ncbi:uncharacterized protein LOC130130452 [Lampris incognitus]|uniref:uncharacterized protein LOC130130452 n=1 Tax=Lampris incognitus TaxID=2546036 RepID=UPI0024B5E966|nr:uncharacterized protein LOC130130452 [Lampris incognitus]